MFTSVEDDMLPDLVADRDRVKLLTELCQQFEILPRINHGGRIKRIIEKNSLGLRREDSPQRFLRQPPMRRFEAHQSRYSSGLADDRKIGIVYGLESDDLVAGLDDGENSAGQRLRPARRHHDLRHGVQHELMPPAIVVGYRLP